MLVAGMLSAATTSVAKAQVSETPIPFDSAGAVRSITPALVARLRLAAPGWPVRDDFVEARLYASSAGGYVLVAERRDGRLDRFALTAPDADALRATIMTAMAQAGRVVSEGGAARISEPARGAFVRNQTLLAAAMYAPAAAALTHDAKAGTVVYLVSVGGTYFLVTDWSKHLTITKAQNALSTDGALRLTGAVFGVYRAFDVDLNTDISAATVLAGGIGGSLLGYRLGRGLTDAEAKAMTSGSTFGGLTAIGLAGTLGLFERDTAERWVAATAVAGGVVGYFAGPSYPRSVRYNVTKGDIQLIDLASLLGVMSAAIPIADNEDVDSRLASGLLTAGGLIGLWTGDRIFARRYDHTENDSRLVALGAIAGGLIGAAIPVLAESESASFILGSVTLGAMVGTMGAEKLVLPRRARPDASRSGAGRESGLRLNLAAAAMAALRRPGVYGIGRIRF
jgi:hypothetical protein